MTTEKQLREIAKNPAAHRRFILTAQLPELVRPRSPLIDLLTQLSSMDRCAMVGFTVNEALGYAGNRQFRNAEVALRWMKPNGEMLKTRSWPAESWRNKWFDTQLCIDDAIEHCCSYPEGLASRYLHLSRASTTPDPDSSMAAEPGPTA